MIRSDAQSQNNDNMAANTLALLIAPSRHDALHELTAGQTGAGTGAALPFALGLHVVDFQLANLRRAGIRDVILVQPEGAGRALQDHLRAVWQPAFDRIACLAGPDHTAFRGFGLTALRRCLTLINAINPQHLLVMSADQICDPDLGAMMAAHRARSAVLTVEAHPGDDPSDRLRDWLPELSLGRTSQTGMMLFDWTWLRSGLEMDAITESSLPYQVINRVVSGGEMQIWSGGEGRPYWRSLETLDAFRVTWLDFLNTNVPPCRLPQTFDEQSAARGPSLPNARDTVIMPGASIGARAFVSRAIIAPGAHVPDGMVIGQDREVDARNFRLTPGGTVLVTAEMLAALP